MPRTSLLYGLDSRHSLLAVWKLLFNPTLRRHLGDERTLFWCEDLIGACAAGDKVDFSARYNSMAEEVRLALAAEPKRSIATPPWSMFSLDMSIGIFPWISPIVDILLFLFFQRGSATFQNKQLLPIAFVLRSGPGDTKQTAIRICAPSQAARVSAEHWLMRGFLFRREQGPHFTLSPEEDGRTFSMHGYTDPSGRYKNIYFETTGSFGREEEDFLEFLHQQ